MAGWRLLEAVSSSLIALGCLGLFCLVAVPVLRARQVRSNRLATATGAICIGFGVGFAIDAVMAVTARGGLRGFPWWLACWDAVTAVIALYYLALRRSHGDLLRAAPSDDLAERERVSESGRMQAESAARVEAEAERDATAIMLRSIIQNTRSAIYVKDLEGRYLMANSQMEKILGRPEADLLGETDDIVDSELAQIWRANDARAQLGPYELEEWNDTFPDGRHYYESVKFPLFDRHGVLYATWGSSLDVTYERRAIAVVEEGRDAALAATAAKSAFLATMSHEIRTPMNAVVGMTDLLLDTELTAQQQEFIDTVRLSGDTLLNVINDILDFSKIESGEMRLEEEPFSLREELENCLEFIVIPAATKGLDLICYVDESCPLRAVGDAGRLRQIVVNLLSNAVKFTANGEILMTANAAATDDDELRLTVAITDTGIGISPDGIERLFLSFSQVDASTTRVYGGTGLGLAISQRLAEATGGGITVESTPGVGTSFTVNILIHPSDEPIEEATDRTPPVDLSGLSVLLVDDNLTCLRMLDLQLTSLGMNCTTVANPMTALDMVRSGHTYDIAILDMRMPDLDGVELAAALRTVPETGSRPIVLLTSVGSRPAGMERSFEAYLPKPVKSAALQDTLVGALGKRPNVRRPEAERPVGIPRMDTQLRVLLAEDNVVNQRVAQLMLDKLGHHVDTVSNGLAAVEAVTRTPYDVVLMDVQMPRMDGLEATRRIRSELPPERQPYVIAMTASVLVEDRRAAGAAGMQSYLSKPVRVQELKSVLERVTRPPFALADVSTGSSPAGEAGPKTPEAQPPVTPPVDEQVLADLANQVGDATGDLLIELIGDYLVEGTEQVARLVDAAGAGDANTVLAMAHTLRSTSGLLGAMQLAELLTAAEDTAHDDLPGLGAVAPAVEAEFARVSYYLRHRAAVSST